jgi:DNA-binding transcriptional MerR regulator
MEPSSDIPQKLFFRIGEVCDLIKVQPHVLRYWETEFPMLSPQKNRAGQRVYRRKDVEMVMRIRNLLYEEKFTIAGARKKISEEMRRGGAPRVKMVPRDKAPEPAAPVNVNEARGVENPISEEAKAEPATPPLISTPAPDSPAPAGATSSSATAAATVHEPAAAVRTQRAIRVLKHNLEELLTLLNSDASIKHST